MMGRVIMYADKVTDAMKQAIDETNRRRAKQAAYNEKHGIEPASVIKGIHDITERLSANHALAEGAGEYKTSAEALTLPKRDLQRLIAEMEKEMKQAAKDLEFERAAALRDQIYELRGLLAEDSKLPPWERARLLSGELEIH